MGAYHVNRVMTTSQCTLNTERTKVDAEFRADLSEGCGISDMYVSFSVKYVNEPV